MSSARHCATVCITCRSDVGYKPLLVRRVSGPGHVKLGRACRRSKPAVHMTFRLFDGGDERCACFIERRVRRKGAPTCTACFHEPDTLSVGPVLRQVDQGLERTPDILMARCDKIHFNWLVPVIPRTVHRSTLSILRAGQRPDCRQVPREGIYLTEPLLL